MAANSVDGPVDGPIRDPSPDRKHDMKVLADGKIMKVQKTRQRKILSCIYCHSKKIKCLRVQPVCNNCNKLGIECKYFINERVSRGGRQPKGRRSWSTDLSNDDSDLLGPVKRELVSLAASDTNKSPMLPKLRIERELERDSSPSSHSDDHDSHVEHLQTDEGPDLASYMGQAARHEPTTPGFLQTPVANASNNITNNFFNTNYSAQAPGPAPEDLLSFNLSSFIFNTAPDGLLNGNGPLQNAPPEGHSHSNSSTNIHGMFSRNFHQTASNFLDNPTAISMTLSSSAMMPTTSTSSQESPSLSSGIPPNPAVSVSTAASVNNSHPNDPGLHNSLNAYSSNPATTVNYLYGTNTYYSNDNLLSDLLKHIPASKERSYELINRYVNSVHILLPVFVSLPDFLKEHDKYWAHFNPYAKHSPSSPDSVSSSKSSAEDFNILQFYTLYLPVLYASTISEFEEYDNLLLNQDINKYLKGFNKICQYYNYPHGMKTIPLLLGNVIVQSTSPNPSTLEMSQVIRYAKFLDLHKDPVLTLRINNWEVVKFRRLLWWVIFGLDALTSHNFCLPPVCKFDDFNVLMPEDQEPVETENGTSKEKRLNVTMLAMNVKFKYDRILSELVYQLHNGLSNNLTTEEINEIKGMIVNLFHFIHKSISRMGSFYKVNPPASVSEMNLINFIKNHSWSFVDRALMLLHKKILTRNVTKEKKGAHSPLDSQELNVSTNRGGILSLSQFEDTFGHLLEANIISNFDNSSISQLRFNQHENFTYENLHNNLIPSILHNLNDFLKYNDFIKFGKFNWYVKRTIPLDSIILLFVIICVKFKYEFMTINELMIYVKLVNKSLFILNRKWFKNEKYKRMLSLTNLTWEYILKRYNVVQTISQYNMMNNKRPGNGNFAPSEGKLEFYDCQVAGYMNMSELFNVMDVPQPVLVVNGVSLGTIKQDDVFNQSAGSEKDLSIPAHENYDEKSFSGMELSGSIFSNHLIQLQDKSMVKGEGKDLDTDLQSQKAELLQLNEKIYYDLRNNFVDINDYCAFYTSLENVLHELMDYIHRT